MIAFRQPARGDTTEVGSDMNIDQPAAHRWTDRLIEASWRRARCSASSCAEVASGEEGVWIRSSSDPDGPPTYLTRDEWVAFVASIKNGDFDDMVA